MTELREPDTVECVEIGDTWVHLRLCLARGHVGCCDSSKNTHATKHNDSTGHGLVLESGERWVYCCADEDVIEV